MKYVLAILFGVLSISCQPKNDIIRVDLARSGAWSDYGGALSVDSSLKYNFCHNTGGGGELTPSYFTGKVSRQFWDTLSRKLEKIKFKTLESTPKMGGSDINYFELVVNWKDGKRQIIREQSFNPADPVETVLNWMDSSFRKVDLKSTAKPFVFQTTYQAGGFEADKMKYFQNLRKMKSAKWNLNKINSVNHEILSDHAIQR